MWARHSGWPLYKNNSSYRSAIAVFNMNDLKNKQIPATTAIEDALLHASWQRAWHALGATPPAGLQEALLTSYRQPERHYHGVQHLRECLAHCATVQSLSTHPGEVEIALWFHDAVYAVRGTGNERKSAQWASQALRAAAIDPACVARVAQLILATEHHAIPDTADARWVVDIDLAILGAPPERFTEYEAQIRAEYAWVPGWLFRRKRHAVLQAFLARPQIYATDFFRARYEAPARDNLRAALG